MTPHFAPAVGNDAARNARRVQRNERRAKGPRRGRLGAPEVSQLRPP